MTQAVVHLLEVVQVDVGQGYGTSLAPTQSEDVQCLFVEGPGVEQVGQRIGPAEPALPYQGGPEGRDEEADDGKGQSQHECVRGPEHS